MKKQYELNGTTHTLSALSMAYGIPMPKLYARIHKLGWSVEDAIRDSSRAAKTHCRNNHKYNDKDILFGGDPSYYIDSRGHRVCKWCLAERRYGKPLPENVMTKETCPADVWAEHERIEVERAEVAAIEADAARVLSELE